MQPPELKTVQTVDWFDLMKWAAEKLGYTDKIKYYPGTDEEMYRDSAYYVLIDDIFPDRFANDAYYNFWLEDEEKWEGGEAYWDMTEKQNRFKALIREEYDLTEDDTIVLWVSW